MYIIMYKKVVHRLLLQIELLSGALYRSSVQTPYTNMDVATVFVQNLLFFFLYKRYVHKFYSFVQIVMYRTLYKRVVQVEICT